MAIPSTLAHTRGRDNIFSLLQPTAPPNRIFTGSRARCSTKFLNDEHPVVQRILGIDIISGMSLLLFNASNFQKVYGGVPFVNVHGLQSKTSTPFGFQSKPFNFPTLKSKNCDVKPLMIQARGNSKTESAKIRNRRMQKKYNGTPTRPRLSVFCSDKQLYAMLVDDQNKKCLFYGSTLQKSMRRSPSCTTIEAAQHVGEELVKACEDLNIHEISSYDRNGFARGEKMQAFEIAISRYGFLQR